VDDWRSILERMRAGDRDAYDRVILLITAYLHREGAYGIRDSWEDVVQEVVLALLRSDIRAETPSAAASLIRATTHSRYVDCLRRIHGTGGWRRPVGLVDAAHEHPDRADDGLDHGLEKAIAALDERERAAVISRYLLGHSVPEGVAFTGEAPATYKRLVQRGLATLRDRIGLGTPS
jgi:DNA-directed RNA polymerase specialized sigma24 family protein